MKPRQRKSARLLWLLPLLLVLVFRLVAAHSSAAVERLFSTGFYPALAAPLSRLTGRIPWGITLPALLILLATVIILLLRRRFFAPLALLIVLATLFLGGWSVNYYRLPLEETLGLPVRDSTSAELEALCLDLGARADAAWAAVTEIPETAVLLSGVNPAYENAALRWPLIPGGDWGSPKEALTSPFMTRCLVEGMTLPLTLEAVINREIPPLWQPYAACHEAAHLRGFAREEDANFLAYLVCWASDDTFFRCSGAVCAYAYAYNALCEADGDAAARTRAAQSAFLSEALAQQAAFWAPYRKTAAAAVSASVNDTYLQTVGSSQSAASYGRVVDLLLAWTRLEGAYQ